MHQEQRIGTGALMGKSLVLIRRDSHYPKHDIDSMRRRVCFAWKPGLKE
jgi:hypothetical protein